MTQISLNTTSIDSEDELQALQQQLHALKELYASAKKSGTLDSDEQHRLQKLTLDNERHLQNIDKLTKAIDERDKKITNLQRAGTDVSTKLRDTLLVLTQTQEKLKEEIRLKEDCEAEIEALHGQFSLLKSRFSEQQKLSNQLTTEKQAWLIEKDRLSSERDLLSKERNEAVHSLAYLQTRFDDLKKFSDERETHLQSESREKLHLQEDLEKAKHAQEEAEARLKFAHFHLAKKVKETTELTDKVQAAESQLIEVKNQFSHMQTKNVELQAALEEQAQQGKLSQQQWQESLKSAEATAAAWEEKCVLFNKKWQESEMRAKELLKISEKYQQMQHLWNRMDTYFERNEADYTRAPIKEFKEEKEYIPPVQPKVETESFSESLHTLHKPFQNLFDMPKPPKRAKQNLFE